MKEKIMTVDSKKANFERAIAKAKEVLEEQCLFDPPVIAERIARNYGLQVRYYKMKPVYAKVAGFIDPKEKTIAVNGEDPAHRQNFTIAHELGHYLLEHTLHQPEYEVLYRKQHPLAVTGNKPDEQEANCFAANLLVPSDMLLDYMRFPFVFDWQLAGIFGVSADVIKYRKKYL
jgi:Zn-dependent peptidase ImmA (M78 family)